MARHQRSTRRFSAKSSRKTRWCGALFQGTFELRASFSQSYDWVSTWFKWPAGHFAPLFAPDDAGQERVEPSDETVVRIISQPSFLIDPESLIQGPVEVVFGLLAFDGGSVPSTYDNASYNQTTSISPPNPALDFSDDWLIRTTFNASQFWPIPQIMGQAESRAKRKCPPDTGILGVLGVANVTGATDYSLPIEWTWDVRMAVRSGYTA